MSLLDLLFPKFCVRCKKFGNYLCDSCFAKLSFDTHPRCFVCNKAAIGGKTHPICVTRYSIDGSFAGIVYAGVVKKLVYQFKYKPYLTDLQYILVDLLYESLIQQEGFYRVLQKKPLLVPIPLHVSKYKKRGYNQAELLAKGLGKKFTLPVGVVLLRTRQTKPQFGLSQQERKENIRDAFSLKIGLENLIKDKTIMLVDDVLTTGATFQEAAKVLKKHGVKEVYAIALAQDK